MRKPMNRRWFYSLWLAVIFMVTACGGAAAPSSGGSSTGTATTAGTPVKGGVITVAVTTEPPTLDWMSSTTTITRLMAWHIYEQLFSFDKDYVVRPMLAEGYTISKDGLSYTIKLRQGIKFHNGKAMTADDVIASMERWGKMSGGGKATFRHVKDVKKIDDNTLVIDLKDKFGPLITNLADPKQALTIMPEEIAVAAGTKPAKEFIGTGPYKFVSWTPNQMIKLVRFDDYQSRSEDWGGLAGKKVAYANEIDFVPVTDPSVRLNGTINGQYDFAQELPQDMNAQIKGNPMLTPVIFKVFNYPGIIFNKAAAPFNDLRMRQAIAYAINDSELMAAAAGPKDFWTLDPGLFFPDQTTLHDGKSGSDVYNHQDLAKAKELLKAANYTGQKIRIMTTKDYTWNYNMAQALREELVKVGINADLLVYDWPTLLTRRKDPTQWDIFLTSFSPSFDPSALIYFNDKWPGWYKSTKMQVLLDKWAATTDEAQKKAVMAEIQTVFYQELPLIKVGNQFGLAAYNNKTLHGYSDFFDIRFWNTWVTH